MRSANGVRFHSPHCVRKAGIVQMNDVCILRELLLDSFGGWCAQGGGLVRTHINMMHCTLCSCTTYNVLKLYLLEDLTTNCSMLMLLCPDPREFNDTYLRLYNASLVCAKSLFPVFFNPHLITYITTACCFHAEIRNLTPPNEQLLRACENRLSKSAEL